MTTTLPRTAASLGRTAVGRLVAVEARLLLRDRATAFFTIAFPAVLLVGLGTLMPWADEPMSTTDPALSQVTAMTSYTPIILALAIGTAALSTFPTTMGTYREKGVLQRLSTTPMRPSRLLVAQLLVTLGALVVASVLSVAAGIVVLDVGLPFQPGVTVVSWLLGATSALAVGCLIASRAPTAGAATALGMLAWTVSMFFAGVWFPLPLMPEVVQTVSGFTPLGAASQAMATGWYGSGLPAQELAVMAAWTLGCVPLAARLFRWH